MRFLLDSDALLRWVSGGRVDRRVRSRVERGGAVVSAVSAFELTQKAVMAGVPALAAVSAPSSLAAEMAEETGMTLVGFLRGRSMNIYAGASRVTGLGDEAG